MRLIIIQYEKILEHNKYVDKSIFPEIKQERFLLNLLNFLHSYIPN